MKSAGCKYVRGFYPLWDLAKHLMFSMHVWMWICTVKTTKNLVSDLPIAKNISFTFIAVFAEVSINNKLFSSAYAWASYKTVGK